MKPYPSLLALDAWSGASELSDEEWLLTALAVSDWAPTFSTGDPDHPPAEFDLPLPVPPPGDAVVRAVAHRFATARAADRASKDEGASMTKVFQSLLERAMLENHGRLFLGWLGPHEPNPWLNVLTSPPKARAIVLEYLDEPRQRFQSLLTAAVSEPPPEPAVTSMWNALRDASRRGPKERRLEAFGALVRLSPLVDSDERLALREEFRSFYASHPVPLGTWPTVSMEPMIGVRRTIWPGEGISWEDDRLSAMLSWSSDIKRETYRFPSDGGPETSTGVFSYVAQAFVSYEEAGLAPLFLMPVQPAEPAPASAWKRQPLERPLEPTPWQRARALHLRRPDLPFPDRGLYRPGKKW